MLLTSIDPKSGGILDQRLQSLASLMVGRTHQGSTRDQLAFWLLQQSKTTNFGIVGGLAAAVLFSDQVMNGDDFNDIDLWSYGNITPPDGWTQIADTENAVTYQHPDTPEPILQILKNRGINRVSEHLDTYDIVNCQVVVWIMQDQHRPYLGDAAAAAWRERRLDLTNGFLARDVGDLINPNQLHCHLGRLEKYLYRYPWLSLGKLTGSWLRRQYAACPEPLAEVVDTTKYPSQPPNMLADGANVWEYHRDLLEKAGVQLPAIVELPIDF